MMRPLTVLVLIAFILVAAWAASGAKQGAETDYFKRVAETK